MIDSVSAECGVLPWFVVGVNISFPCTVVQLQVFVVFGWGMSEGLREGRTRAGFELSVRSYTS